MKDIYYTVCKIKENIMMCSQSTPVCKYRWSDRVRTLTKQVGYTYGKTYYEILYFDQRVLPGRGVRNRATVCKIEESEFP